MKNRFHFLLPAATLLLALGACQNELDDMRVTVTPASAPTLTASTANAGVLLSAKAAETAVTYTWTPVTYTVSDGSNAVIPVTYTLEFAKAGTNFAQVSTLDGGTDKSSVAVKVSELNTALVKAGLTPAVEGTADVRIRANYAANQTDLLSATTTIKATPYSRDLFLYGSGTNPTLGALNDKSPFLREGKTPGQFEGYVYVPDATNTFKLSNTTTSAGTVFGAGTSAGTVAVGGSELTLAGPNKVYRVQVNQSTGTFKADVTTWGVVGSATTGDGTGWNQSVPMVYDAKDGVWKATGITLSGVSGNNEFKFRANDAWTINLGADKTNAAILAQDGDNLKAPSTAKYDVTLDLKDPDKYVYSIAKK
jgi:hypothetical protein